MARVKLSQLRLRSPFFKKKKSSNNNGQASSAEFAAENSAELGSGAGSDETARTFQRLGLRWASDIHERFLDAVDQLGTNIYNAKPDHILRVMAVEGLTRCQVKSHLQKIRLRGLSGAGGDADGDAVDDDGDNNDGDNNGGGGDKNKKKGGGHSDGEGNGDCGDKAEGGDGEEKGMNKDCTGQLGYGYGCTYHAGYENGYPVEVLRALIMFYLFYSENMMNYCSIMPPVRDVSLIDMGLNSADSMQEGRT